jgi:hypothetical protein
VKYANDCDAFWTASKWGVDVARASGVTVPCAVVPEGTDTGVFRPDGAAMKLPGDSKFRFLTIGKLEVRKNIDTAVRAFNTAFRDNREVAMVLAVDNPFIGEVDYSAWLKYVFGNDEYNANQYIFVPRVTSKYDVASLYRACNAFVLPTRGEGFGLPIIEAMATGLPVITTNWSAPTEYLRPENACLVPPGEPVQADDPMFGGFLRQGKWANPSVADVAAAMQKVYKDESYRASIGATARKDCEAKWTWRHAAERFTAEVDKACAL